MTFSFWLVLAPHSCANVNDRSLSLFATAKRKREEKNEEEIDDVLLYELSERIHEDRKKMALALGLNYVEEITPIEKKIPDDVVGQTFELFQRWKQR